MSEFWKADSWNQQIKLLEPKKIDIWNINPIVKITRRPFLVIWNIAPQEHLPVFGLVRLCSFKSWISRLLSHEEQFNIYATNIPFHPLQSPTASRVFTGSSKDQYALWLNSAPLELLILSTFLGSERPSRKTTIWRRSCPSSSQSWSRYAEDILWLFPL